MQKLREFISRTLSPQEYYKKSLRQRAMVTEGNMVDTRNEHSELFFLAKFLLNITNHLSGTVALWCRIYSTCK
jgi:hypothetical protein